MAKITPELIPFHTATAAFSAGKDSPREYLERRIATQAMW